MYEFESGYTSPIKVELVISVSREWRNIFTNLGLKLDSKTKFHHKISRTYEAVSVNGWKYCNSVNKNYTAIIKLKEN
jgi:hypothetical protein